MACTNPVREKKKLKEIIENPENNPVLIDTNIISGSGNDGESFYDYLKNHRTEQVNLRKLKEFDKYLSFLGVSAEKEKVLTVPGVVVETGDLITQTRDLYKRRFSGYKEYFRDAIMSRAKSYHVQDASTLHIFSAIRGYISRLEEILKLLALKSSRYEGNKDFVGISSGVKKAAERAEERGVLKKVSKADVGLVAASIYEVLFFRKTPTILSYDRDIITILGYSLFSNIFPADIRERARGRIRVYRNFKLVELQDYTKNTQSKTPSVAEIPS